MATNCTRHLQLKSSKGVGHQQTSPWRWFRRAREPPEALPSRRGPFHCHGPGCTRRPVSTHPPHGHHSGGQPTDCLCRSSRDEETLVAAVCVGACPPESCADWLPPPSSACACSSSFRSPYCKHVFTESRNELACFKHRSRNWKVCGNWQVWQQGRRAGKSMGTECTSLNTGSDALRNWAPGPRRVE